jgi:hypothetical protein
MGFLLKYMFNIFIISIKSFQVNYNIRLFSLKFYHNYDRKALQFCLPKRRFGIKSTVEIDAIKMHN